MSEPQQFLVSITEPQQWSDPTYGLEVLTEVLETGLAADAIKVESADLSMLTAEEQERLPLLIQIMQAQYLGMADTMNRQVELAKAEAEATRKTLRIVFKAVQKQQEQFAGLGVSLGTAEVDAALAMAALEIGRNGDVVGET